MLNSYAMEVLTAMVGVESIEEVPSGLVARVERVDELVKTSDLPGELGSRQTMAVVVEQWERDQSQARLNREE